MNNERFKAYVFVLLLLTLCFSLYGEPEVIIDSASFNQVEEAGLLMQASDLLDQKKELLRQPINFEGNSLGEFVDQVAVEPQADDKETAMPAIKTEIESPDQVVVEHKNDDKEAGLPVIKAEVVSIDQETIDPVVSSSGGLEVTLKEADSASEVELAPRISLSGAWRDNFKRAFNEDVAFIKNIITTAESSEEKADFVKRFALQDSWLDNNLRTAGFVGDLSYNELVVKQKIYKELVESQEIANSFIDAAALKKGLTEDAVQKIRCNVLYELYSPSQDKGMSVGASGVKNALTDYEIEALVDKVIALYVAKMPLSKVEVDLVIQPPVEEIKKIEPESSVVPVIGATGSNALVDNKATGIVPAQKTAEPAQVEKTTQPAAEISQPVVEKEPKVVSESDDDDKDADSKDEEEAGPSEEVAASIEEEADSSEEVAAPSVAATGSVAPSVAATGSVAPSVAATGSVAPSVAATGSVAPNVAATGSTTPEVKK